MTGEKTPVIFYVQLLLLVCIWLFGCTETAACGIDRNLIFAERTNLCSWSCRFLFFLSKASELIDGF